MIVGAVGHFIIPNGFGMDIASRFPRIIVGSVPFPVNFVLSGGRVVTVPSQALIFKLVTPLALGGVYAKSSLVEEFSSTVQVGAGILFVILFFQTTHLEEIQVSS